MVGILWVPESRVVGAELQGRCCIERSADLMPSTWVETAPIIFPIVWLKPFNLPRCRESTSTR
jgi:hypothetical protein